MNIESTLHTKIESVADTWVRFARDLVRIPSCTGAEQEAQAFVSDAMKELGIFHKHVYYDGADDKHNDRDYAERPNVVGLLDGSGSANFILNAHIDTVAVENEASWTFPPFAAEVHEGKLYGRGALDDKAGIAMMLMIAQVLRETEYNLPFSVFFESVIEDEDTGNGTKACTESGIYAEAAIVIDGTWPFRIIDAHLGQLWIEFEIKGVPVASCSHARGRNPIIIATRLLDGLTRLIEEKNERNGQWHNIVDPYFVTPGTIEAGRSPAAIPEQCTLVCQFGFPPSDTVESICAEVNAVLSAQLEDERHLIDYKIKALCTDSFENRENRMVRILRSTIKRLRVGEMEPINVAVTGHCDLRNLKTRTGALSEACLYGPGGGGNPHVKDEFYMLEHFVPVAQNIVSAMLEWCSSA